MDKRKSVSILAAGVLVLVAVFGALTYKTVSAQDDTPTPTEPAQTVPEIRKSDRGLKGGATQEDLAAALGITVEDLAAAQQAAQAEALEQAVSAGLITQEQADQITERGLGRKLFGRWLEGSEIDPDALLADALGISVEELQGARSAAYSAALDRAVEEGRLTQEQADLMKARQALFNDETFQSNMRSAYEAAIQQAVEDGVITQAQADAILTESSGTSFRGWGGFDSRHGFGGRGGRHGGFDLVPGTEPPAITPSTDA